MPVLSLETVHQRLDGPHGAVQIDAGEVVVVERRDLVVPRPLHAGLRIRQTSMLLATPAS